MQICNKTRPKPYRCIRRVGSIAIGSIGTMGSMGFTGSIGFTGFIGSMGSISFMFYYRLGEG